MAGLTVLTNLPFLPSEEVDWWMIMLFAIIGVLSVVLAIAIIQEFHLYSFFDGRKV
jgi:hypothetical protein